MSRHEVRKGEWPSGKGYVRDAITGDVYKKVRALADVVIAEDLQGNEVALLAWVEHEVNPKPPPPPAPPPRRASANLDLDPFLEAFKKPDDTLKRLQEQEARINAMAEELYRGVQVERQFLRADARWATPTPSSGTVIKK